MRRRQPPLPRRPVRRALPWYARPFDWWSRHAWVPVWVAVILTPVALVSLRLVDDTALGVVVHSILGVMIVVFLVVVAVAMRGSAARSLGRALAGGGSALVAAAVLTLPMIQVMGQRPCPERMGPDRGQHVSTEVFDAWRNGHPPPAAVWASDAVAQAWNTRVDKLMLVDYRATQSGCWERLAPVATTETWHEFRVTIERSDGARFSKIVTVHTSAMRGGWAVAEIEGPEA